MHRREIIKKKKEPDKNAVTNINPQYKQYIKV